MPSDSSKCMLFVGLLPLALLGTHAAYTLNQQRQQQDISHYYSLYYEMILLIQYHQCLKLVCICMVVHEFFLQGHQYEFLSLLPILGCQLWRTHCHYCCCDPSCFSEAIQHFCWSHCIRSYMSCFVVNALYFMYICRDLPLHIQASLAKRSEGMSTPTFRPQIHSGTVKRQAIKNRFRRNGTCTPFVRRNGIRRNLYKALPNAIPVSGPPPVSIISPYAISTTLTLAHEQYGRLAVSCKSALSAQQTKQK